jgi:hypothetical protein
LFPPEPETVAYPGEPAIWIQRVEILPARRPGVEPIRNIEFRRGLTPMAKRVTYLVHENPALKRFGDPVLKAVPASQ